VLIISKAGTVLAIMGLIIGASGVGIGLVSMYQTSQLKGDYDDFIIDYNEPKIWYKEYEYAMAHWTLDDYNTFEQLAINFTVEANETMYFCYTGEAMIFRLPRDFSQLSIYFNIDGNHLVTPKVTIGAWDAYSDIIYQSITLQFSTTVLSIGAHNITIDLTSTYNSNLIKQNTLIVMAIPD